MFHFPPPSHLIFFKPSAMVLCVVDTDLLPRAPFGNDDLCPRCLRGLLENGWLWFSLPLGGVSCRKLPRSVPSVWGSPPSVIGLRRGMKVRSPQHRLGEGLTAVQPQSCPWGGLTPSLLPRLSPSPLHPPLHLRSQGDSLVNIPDANLHQSQLPKKLQHTKKPLELFAYFFHMGNIFLKEYREKSEQTVMVQISDFSPSLHLTIHGTRKWKQNVTRTPSSQGSNYFFVPSKWLFSYWLYIKLFVRLTY